MSELTIPSLSLFNRSPPKRTHLGDMNHTKTQHSFIETLRDDSRLRRTPYLPSTVENCFEDEHRMLRRHK